MEEMKEIRGKKKEMRKKFVCGGERKENGSDSQCSKGRKSIDRELKLVYSTRATSKCQKLKEVGFSPTFVLLNLRVVNGRAVQP